jgi:PTH1 family peptidyl-tRNA hydrolase
MRSILYQMRSDAFPRVRIGIGGERRSDLAGYVLGGFPQQAIETVENAVRRAADAVECLLRDGVAAAMNQYNPPPETQDAVRGNGAPPGPDLTSG